jgi:hypothetical protein
MVDLTLHIPVPLEVLVTILDSLEEIDIVRLRNGGGRVEKLGV